MKTTMLTNLLVCSAIFLSGCGGKDSSREPQREDSPKETQKDRNVPLVCTSDPAPQGTSLLFGERPEITEPFDYDQVLADYIGAGWMPQSLNNLGPWVNDIIGTGFTAVDWTPYEDTPASCSQDHPGSTGYLFKPLAPGYRYVLKASFVNKDFPLDEIALIAYGTLEETIEDSEPVFLQREFQGESFVDGDNTTIQFEFDSRYMTSINIKLKSENKILWSQFELGIVD